MMIKIKEGVTVVEVLIALVVIVAAIIALIQGKGLIVNKSSVTAQQAQAMVIARDHLAQLRKSTDGPTTGSTVVNSKSTSYTVNWFEQTYSNPDNKTVTVTVAWNSGKGVQQLVGVLDDIKLKKSVERSEVVDEI
ncbi:MAG: hypothetical protein P1U40_00235 [Coxiellaceae bacterium]|nr:hypothetical protein [Coxiellaceae bacterium]